MFSSVKVELFVNEVDKVFAKDGPSPFAPIFSDFSVPFVPKAFAKAIPPSIGYHFFFHFRGFTNYTVFNLQEF